MGLTDGLLTPLLSSGTPTVFEDAIDVVPTGFVGVFLLGVLLYHHAPRGGSASSPR